MKNSKKLEIPIEKNGYFNVWKFVQEHESDFDIFIIVGGRRLGKTYSVLRGLVQDKKQHLYVRRTDSDLDECLTARKNPYRQINNDYRSDVRIVAKGKDKNIMLFENDEVVDNLGYASSVSTSGSVRGAFMEDIEYIIYDEFINLKPVNTLKKYEGNLFFDLYDTANNDRDLRGKKPLKAILLSNANSIDDGLIRQLKLGHVIYEMLSKDTYYYADYERRIYLALLPSNNDISKKREKSAIGRLTGESSYSNMAMKNEFNDSYLGDIYEKVRYQEYNPFCSFNNIYFYKHKGDGHILASYRKAKCKAYTNHTIKKFKRDFGMMIGLQIESGRIHYINYDIKLDVAHIF